MSLEIEEIKVVKLKLFELLEDKNASIALGAINFLIQLAQIPTSSFQEESLQVMKELRDVTREGIEMEKKKNKEELE